MTLRGLTARQKKEDGNVDSAYISRYNILLCRELQCPPPHGLCNKRNVHRLVDVDMEIWNMRGRTSARSDISETPMRECI